MKKQLYGSVLNEGFETHLRWLLKWQACMGTASTNCLIRTSSAHVSHSMPRCAQLGSQTLKHYCFHGGFVRGIRTFCLGELEMLNQQNQACGQRRTLARVRRSRSFSLEVAPRLITNVDRSYNYMTYWISDAIPMVVEASYFFQKYMDTHGHPWTSMDIHWYPLIFVDIHVYPWISIDIHGYPWISVDIHRYP